MKEAVADAEAETSQEEDAEGRPCAPRPEHAMRAALNSLASVSGQRTYDRAIREFVGLVQLGFRLAFNRAVVVRYRTDLDQRGMLR